MRDTSTLAFLVVFLGVTIVSSEAAFRRLGHTDHHAQAMQRYERLEDVDLTFLEVGASVQEPTSLPFVMGFNVTDRGVSAREDDSNYIDLSLRFPTAGKLCRWSFFADSPGSLQLELWRASRRWQEGHYFYELHDKEMFHTSEGLQLCPSNLVISEGDFIGWRFTNGSSGVYYRENGRGQVRWSDPMGTNPSVGDVVYFPHAASRDYSIETVYREAEDELEATHIECFPPEQAAKFREGHCYGQLATMSPPELVANSGRWLDVGWIAPKDFGQTIQSFELQVLTAEDEWKTIYNAHDWSFRMEGLQPVTDYTFRVRACAANSVLSGEWSDKAALTTDAEPPAKPDPPTTGSQGPRSLTVVWTAPFTGGANLTGFALEMMEGVEGETELQSIYRGPFTSIKVDDLVPFSSYRFRVQAFNRKGASVPSDWNVMKTLAHFPETTRIELVEKTGRTIALKWEEPVNNGRPINRYRLQRRDRGERSWMDVPLDTLTERSVIVRALTPVTNYTFQLAACNEKGCSAWCEPASYVTEPDAPEPMKAPALFRATNTSLTVNWTAPIDNGAPILRYILDVNRHDEDDEAAGVGFRELARLEGTHHSSYTLSQLRPAHLHSFRIRAVNDRGSSPDSPEATFLTRPGVPAAPEPPILLRRTSDTLEFEWKKPEANGAVITDYRVESDYGLGGGNWSLVYEGTDLDVMADGLVPATTYRFRVAARNEVGYSPFSDEAVFDTEAGFPTAPGPVTRVSADASSIKVKWTAANGNGLSVLGYSLFMAEDREDETGEKMKLTEVNNGTQLVYIAEPLLPNTAYRFKVQAFNAKGRGDVSEITSISTAAGPPDAPDIPVVISHTAHSAAVEWNPPADNGAAIATYRLDMAQGEEGCGFKPVHSGLNTSFVMNGLEPNHKYTFQVLAKNAEGWGEVSEPVEAKTDTDKPDPVPKIRLLGVGPRSVMLGWDSAKDNGAPITAYTLQFREKAVGSTTSQNFVTVYSGPDRSFEKDGLDPATAYEFRVQPENERGVAEFSKPLTFETTPDVPGKPNAPHLVNVAAFNMTVEWTPALANGDAITSYQLEMRTGTELWNQMYDGPKLRTTVVDLQPLTAYAFRLRADNHEGWSQWSDIIMFETDSAPPARPAAPIVTRHGDWSQAFNHTSNATAHAEFSGLRLPLSREGLVDAHAEVVEDVAGSPCHFEHMVEWVLPDDNGAPITTVKIVSDKSDDKWIEEASVPGTQTAAVIGKRCPGTVYHYCLEVLNSKGKSPRSVCSEVTEPPIAPGMPGEPFLKTRTDSSIQFTWKVPLSDGGAQISSYRVEYKIGEGSWRHVEECGATGDTTCLIQGLAANQAIRVRVFAINHVGTGPSSDEATLRTSSTTPSQPGFLTISDVSPSSMKVAWKPPSDNGGSEIDAYEVFMAPGLPNTEYASVHKGKVLAYTAKELRPGLVYRFRIRAHNNNGDGDMSDEVEAETKPGTPSKPNPITLVEAGVTSLTIAWKVPDGNGADVLTCDVERADGALGAQEFLPVYSGVEEHQFTVKDLELNSVSKFRVRCSNVEGASAWSDESSFRTKEPITVDAGAAADGTGSSSNPFKSLQKALDAAKPGDVVLVKAGTYTGDDSTESATAFRVPCALTLRGEGPETILDGGGAQRVLETAHGSLVRTLTLANGYGKKGGGALCRAKCQFDRVVFRANEAYDGGGLYVADGEEVTVEDCSFEQNRASRDGGGVYVSALEHNRVKVANNALRNNLAGRTGGGVFVTGFGEPVFNKLVLGSNHAVIGGGMHTSGVDTHIEQCTFDGNTGTEMGGGLSVYQGRPKTDNCVLQNNHAKRGGGMVLRFTEVEVANTNIQSNSATEQGAGVWIGGMGDEAPVVFRTVVVSDNSGPSLVVFAGQAVFQDSKLRDKMEVEDSSSVQISDSVYLTSPVGTCTLTETSPECTPA